MGVCCMPPNAYAVRACVREYVHQWDVLSLLAQKAGCHGCQACTLYAVRCLIHIGLVLHVLPHRDFAKRWNTITLYMPTWTLPELQKAR